ncbi:MAG: hypothetical protein M1833_004255 [Piccolia ochrophora]|nr:MAG: hypothetical protein M1833_004255 [Piccolia ochrophora]
MLDGLFMLLSLSTVMVIAYVSMVARTKAKAFADATSRSRRSIVAGALPLSFSLSKSQLRLVSSLGMGILVGTSLIVIIPEGIETLYTAAQAAHTPANGRRQLGVQGEAQVQRRWADHIISESPRIAGVSALDPSPNLQWSRLAREKPMSVSKAVRRDAASDQVSTKSDLTSEPPGHASHQRSPHTFVGLSLILGFILMYLIEQVPQHSTTNSQASTQPHHISLENLSQGFHRGSSPHAAEESEEMLDSHTSSQQSRGTATTIGLVIHSIADGIALGASSTTTDTRLGLIIFVAIMVHKAPAAFGLTSVLLKQGLTKRRARAHLIVFSFAAPLGALATWTVVNLLGRGRMGGAEGTQWWTGILLLFSAGTFL